MISNKRVFVDIETAGKEIMILKSIGLIPVINIVFESGQTVYSIGYIIRE